MIRLMLAALLTCAAGGGSVLADTPVPIAWKKTVLDTKFRSEGVAIADVNNDGKPDILVGEVWYEAPDWKPHVIHTDKTYDPSVYSESFAVFPVDINKDGWVDEIVIRFPGKPCFWYENPKGAPGPWKEHEIWHSVCNETTIFADLFGTGQKVIVMGWQPKGKEKEGQLAWFAPGADPTKIWEMHAISEPSTPKNEIPGTFRFYHGLGVGDMNGDGRPDVICRHGWWEQPKDAMARQEPWVWHPAGLGEDCSNMIVLDLDGDGKADVVSSSAHRFGIWAHLQRPASPGPATFLKKDLFPKLVSQTHALECADMDGDGVPDLVTGKRWWAHGPKGDAEPNASAMLYWLRGKRLADGLLTFEPLPIDNDSGVGTQFAVGDINKDGRPDVAIANKKGVFVLIQQPASEANEPRKPR
ncbi:MAG: VCBS repeat-containing protein [Gemmataceae bacterium]|nr:VCBS repeat-containing protein [Gemmataceae bacterium]